MLKIPELVAPAGSPLKLKMAVFYGADAVYLAGKRFGLRTAAENFTNTELCEACSFAHDNGVRVYVALNGFLHDKDMCDLDEYVRFLEKIKVDAVIVSDIGVMRAVRDNSALNIHLSTQNTCLNTESAKFWKDLGVKRIVLGREVSILEAKRIREMAGVEIEMFVHGSMCMSYSGNCTISNYTFGRDSNRGGCKHSCRFEYDIEWGGKKRRSDFFMSSKDLMAAEYLEDFAKAGIDAVKIEGRMKTPYYLGTVCKTYSELLCEMREHGYLSLEKISSATKELRKISHRDYCTGNLLEKASADSIFNEREMIKSSFEIVAIVFEVKIGEYMLAQVKNGIKKEDELELLLFKGKPKKVFAGDMKNVLDEPLESARPGILVKLPYVHGAGKWNLLRRSVSCLQEING